MGLLTAKRGNTFLVQTLNVMVVVFFVQKYAKKMKCTAEKTFPQNEVHLYEKRMFLANEAYRIPSGKKYIPFSSQVSFSALVVVNQRLEIPFKFTNAIETVIAKFPSTIERPPSTPYIEEEETKIKITFS